MRHEDCQWMIRLLKRNCPGAEWVKLLKVGDTRVTCRVRWDHISESDREVHDREAFLAGLHSDVWEARLARVDQYGEIYEVIFAIPKQMSFL